MNRLLSTILLIFIGLVGFAGAAYAAQIPDDPLLDLGKPVYEAVTAGNYYLAAALALVFLVAAASRYLPWKFLKSGAGKAMLVLLASFGGALATAAAAWTVPSWGAVYAALKVALAASGGYSLAKALLVPWLKKLKGKLPAWAQPLLAMLLWAFENKAEEKAKEAGDEAVAENPPGGVEAVLGEPKDVP